MFHFDSLADELRAERGRVGRVEASPSTMIFYTQLFYDWK
jgi:hypothetical protein